MCTRRVSMIKSVISVNRVYLKNIWEIWRKVRKGYSKNTGRKLNNKNYSCKSWRKRKVIWNKIKNWLVSIKRLKVRMNKIVNNFKNCRKKWGIMRKIYRKKYSFMINRNRGYRIWIKFWFLLRCLKIKNFSWNKLNNR